ncbi:MAG: hypothetical protein KC502_02835 [Myxococcales bacterium]|nr:hypothetical protein [Myxococcales bacterium]
MQLPRISLVAAAVALITSGCFVQIEDKSQTGTDPCTPNPCQKEGVCAEWTGTCSVTDGAAVCSAWKTTGDGAGDAPAAYEAEETLCDGLDNDCDGLTDESPKADLAKACPTEGACKGQQATAVCAGGAWQCSFVATPAWEVTETLCDGIDNDCDGETDEGAVPTLKTCKRAGVCSGLAAPTCAEGKWDCHYDDATDYEATEQSCDGKDNDCNGKVDTDLSVAALPGGAKCKDLGVCADGVSIVCKGGVAVCDYAAVSDWEAVETTCDSKDNDCDGTQDNIQGSKLALKNSDTGDCNKTGVCKASANVSRTCAGGKWACDYGAVPYYEAKESLCDGRDNDCDGKADNNLPEPATSPCGSAGVCGEGKSVCSGGLWTCDWAALGKKGYEAFEQVCDGKDNDCDGKTDETLSAASNGCKTQGVCAHGSEVGCKAGKAVCDYGFVLAFEATETSCDGKDNDCDGQTDEAESLDVSQSGCAVGVCKGSAKATCGNGKWQCSFKDVKGYESSELSCDGKDNDCDGKTDEGLTDVTAAKCKTLGVCKGAAAALCTGGKYACTYTANDYQSTESLCDGKDNDCDGQTDTGLCSAGNACTANTQCKTGGCTKVLGGTGSVCTDKANQCAQRGSDGKVSYVDNGTVSCADASSTQTCTSGAFASPKACPKSSPACVSGVCQLCVPNEKRCDASKPGDVVKCSADGKSQTKLTTCQTGKCAGAGVCVVKTTITANKATVSGSQPAVAAIDGGGFVVVWVDAQPLSNVIVGRMYKADGSPVGAQFDISDKKKPTDSLPSVAALGKGFAAVWTSGDKGSDVILRKFDAAGKAIGGEEALATTTTGVQRHPTITAFGGGVVAAWTSESVDAKGSGVVLQRYDATGEKLGKETLVNAKSTAQPESEAADESGPSLAALGNGELVVSWVRVANGIGAVWARRFSSKGLVAGAPSAISSANVNINQARIAFGSNGIGHGVWRQLNGSDGWDVMHVRISADLKPVGTATIIHKTVTDEQSLPSVSVATDGRLTAVWQSYSKADGYDLRVRDQLASGAWASADTLLISPAKGEQDQGTVLAFADGRTLFAWRARTSDIAKGLIQLVFR